MFDKFKNLARLLSFILIFNFLVLNFGIKPKEVRASEISSVKMINYDISIIDNYIVFDFSKSLAEGDTIQEVSLLKGTTKLNIENRDNTKKSWRTKEVLIHGTTYQLNISANIGGTSRKLVSTFVYNDYDIDFKPVMAIAGNNVECDIKTWAAQFPENLNVEVDILTTSGSVEIQKVTKTIKQAKTSKIVFENKKTSLEPRGYIVRAKVADREYRSKFYYSGQWAKNLNLELVSGQPKENKNNLFDIELKINMGLSNGDSLRLYSGGDGHSEGVHKGNNVYRFENVEMSFNRDYHVRVQSTDSEKIRESMFSFCSLYKIEKLNSRVDSSTGSSLTFDLSDLNKFLSINSSNNKIYIHELNDSFGKGNKIGEKTSVTASSGITVSLNSGVSLSTSKNYLVEVTNGSKTISSSFMYVTMGSFATEVKETSAKINWTYPTGYTPQAEHKVEIYLRDKANSSSYSAVPNAALVHGTGNGKVDLSRTTSTVINGIAPGTNYEVKIVLNNQRGAVVSFTEFTTNGFRLKEQIKIKDALYDTSNKFYVAYPRSRTITVEWNFDGADINFSPSDKVEIWVKPNSSGEFSGYPKDSKYNNPVFTRTGNDLKSVKTATVTLPNWLVKYHVDLIYTIGGKQIITRGAPGEIGEVAYNRRTVTAHVDAPNIEVTDITQTGAKVKWVYDPHVGTYQPENGHIIRVDIKKIPSANDYTTDGFTEDSKVFYKVHGKDGNILNIKECELTGLEVGQHYRIRVQHILHHEQDNGGQNVLVQNFYNFQTGAFTIENLKATQIDQSPKVKLTWGTTGDVQFSEQDSIKVYLKEGNTSEYPTEPLQNVTISDYKDKSREGDDNQQVQPTKECTIELPKYNTQYNVKLEYTLKGKKIEQITMARADGDIRVSIPSVDNSSATIKCHLPEGYEVGNRKDKIKLKVVKKGEDSLRQAGELGDFKTGKIIDVTSNTLIQEINGLSEEPYDVEVAFINDNSTVSIVSTSFTASSEFQIVALVAKDVTMNSAKLSWDYAGTHTFVEDQDKLDIFIKDITKDSEEKTRKTDDDIKSGYKKIISYTHKNDSAVSVVYDGAVMTSGEGNHSRLEKRDGNLNDVKSVELSELLIGKEYSIKLQYMKGGSSDTANGDPREVTFETMSAKFDATVFTSNQTTATFGWEYPKGYTLKNNDKVEIFIKEINDSGDDVNPQPEGLGYNNALLTLIHGTTGDNVYDLNEVTKVDVSGLTPEKKYKAKVKFTMNGGTSPSIETEANISTKSFSIKSFTVDSYQEYDILVKWEIEPENMIFNPADTLKIFVKLATDENYPNEASYVLTTTPTQDGKTISNTFSDYVLAESIGVEQKMKMVYTVGGREYTEELTFTNNIDPLKAKVFSVDETRALIEVTAPSNYEFVNGDALLIYAKDEFSDGDVESDDFLVFEGVQSDDLSIADDMKLIELSYLLPEAKYDIVVALDLEDGTVDPVKLEFTTKALPITDIKLESINFDGSTISWGYGNNEIDFYKDEQNDNFTDKLLVGVKESDGTPIPNDFGAIKQIAVEEHSGQDIASVKNAKIVVEDKTKDYDVAICCDIGGLSYIKQTKLSFLSVLVDESSILSDGAKVTWKYPSNITFGDSDKTEVFVRKKDDSNYPESPAFSSTGSGTTSYNLEGLEGSTEYIVKVQITKEGLTIDPVEAEFTTKGAASSEVVVEEPEYEITGTAAEIGIPNAEELDIDLEKSIGLKMGDEPFTGFSIKFNENGTGFTIEPTIPKKKYENIEVEIPLKDGTTFKMVIKEFTTQPADTAQDWLSNAYWFAFERFPDEEGYNYWYAHRIIAKTLNGEYFLKNLLFAEDEFTNRNLQDKELIAALYQIVVNREYDEEGLNFWVGIYGENLQNAQGNKKLAQEVLVDRMSHEPEFGKLCEKVGIFWRQIDQDAAGVPS